MPKLKVDVIVTVCTPPTIAAQKATTTIPIVMGGGSDPVANGLVKSLARPGSNITGITNMSADLSLKHFEMLLAMVPKLSRLAVLINPSNTDHIKSLELVQAEGQKRGVKILRAEARTPEEIDKAFSWIRQQNAGALIVFVDQLFVQQKKQIAELIAKHRLPAVTQSRINTEAGILMSYGTKGDGLRRTAYYVDRILKGTKPADLPVEQPMIFELVINGKTAKALGLEIPQGLLISANKVIE